MIDLMAHFYFQLDMVLSIPRSCFGTLVRNDWVYIGGGNNGRKDMTKYEKINFETRECVILPLVCPSEYIMHLFEGPPSFKSGPSE